SVASRRSSATRRFSSGASSGTAQSPSSSAPISDATAKPATRPAARKSVLFCPLVIVPRSPVLRHARRDQVCCPRAGVQRSAPRLPSMKRLLWTAAAVAVASAASLALLLTGSLPRRDGELRLGGLAAPVTIELDGAAIPRIRAETVEDAYRAQG